MSLQNIDQAYVSGCVDGEALKLCALAKELEARGDYQAAREVLTPAWGVLDNLAESTRAYVLLRTGLLTCRLSSAGQGAYTIEQAKDLLTKGLEVFEKLGDASGASEACYGLGLCLRYEGAFDDARLWLRSALERAGAADAEMQCKILLLSAIVEKDAWRLHDALKLHERIALLCDSIENHILIGTHHNEFAVVLDTLAKLEKKGEYEQRALIEYEGACYHYETGGNERFLGSAVNNLGCLLVQMGRPLEALGKVGQAIAIAEKVKDKTRQAEYLETKAQALVALKQYAEAEKAARRSVELLRFSGQHSLLAESSITHGLTLAKLDRTGDSERTLKSAEEVAAYVGDVETAGRALVTLLEECAALPYAERSEAHCRIADYLKDSQNNELNARHLRCIKMTFESAKEGAESPATFGPGFSLPTYLSLMEVELIKRAFKESDGSLVGAAKLLGITASCLNEKKKKYPVINDLLKNPKRRSIIKDNGPQGVALDIGCVRMPDDDDSMSGLGIRGGDVVIFRKGGDAKEGEPVVLISRGIDFVGIYHETALGIELLPASEEYDIWLFQPKTFKVAGKVVAYIKAADIGRLDAEVHELSI
jgi:tetratricopeptide (TPR) repeat protein